MKLSIGTCTVRERFGDEKAIEMLKAAGFDACDYSLFGAKNFGNMLEGDYVSYAKHIKSVMVHHGLVCNQSHAPFVFRYENNKIDISDPYYSDIVKSIEFSSIIEAPHVVVHAITVPEDVDFYEYNYNYFKSFEKYCEKYNVRIAIENLFIRDEKRQCYKGKLGNPAELMDFIKKLDSKWFYACLDTGHSALTGTEPEVFISSMDNNTIKALHIHDNNYLSDMHMLPFTGKMNWTKITESLRNIKYDGDLTLESGGFLRGFGDDMFLDALKFSAKVGRTLIKMINQ